MSVKNYLKLYMPLLAAGCIALLVAAGGCELIDPNPGPAPIETPAGDSTGAPIDNTPATVERGKDLYALNCARCHGENAEGTVLWEPPIQGRLGIYDVVRNGRRSMPAYPHLSDSAIASIELFLRSYKVDFGAKSTIELYEIFCSGCHGDSGTGTNVFAGNIQGYSPIHDIVRNGRGDMLAVPIPDSIIDRIQGFLSSFTVDLKTVSGEEYYSYKCAGCHGAVGEGTTRGYEVRDQPVGYATYVIRNGRPGVPFFRDSMPKYTTDDLSDQQLDQMLTWLRKASNPRSGKLLYNRFCAGCHGYDALGGPVNKPLRFKGTDDFEDAARTGKGKQDYHLRNKFMPARSITELSSEEIALIANYVRGLR